MAYLTASAYDIVPIFQQMRKLVLLIADNILRVLLLALIVYSPIIRIMLVASVPGILRRRRFELFNRFLCYILLDLQNISLHLIRVFHQNLIDLPS